MTPSDLPIKPCDPFTPPTPSTTPTRSPAPTAAPGGLPSISPQATDSSSLDTQETSVGIRTFASFLAEKPVSFEQLQALMIGEPTAAEKFRHSGWWPIRKRVIASLKRTGQSDSRIRNFCTCGRTAWVQRSDVDAARYRIVQNNCHDRLCTPCAQQRSFQIRTALMQHIDGRPVKFCTLTLCGKGEKLTDLIDRLYRSFRNLRAHPTWADRVEGGAAVLELKYSLKAKRWHPHLHIVFEGKYIPQWELSDVWRGITKDSMIVDIRAVKNPDVATSYVCKYASKALDSTFALSPDLLDEAVLALRGRRLVTCFGDWYGTPLQMAEDEELADDLVDAAGWHNLMPLEECLERTAAGDAFTRSILQLLRMDARAVIAANLDSS